jgi:hypothetical protein
MVQAAMRITTILSEQHIESTVEHLMWHIQLLGVHDVPDLVVLGPLRHRVCESA